jgi:hypothetical protein
MNLYEQVEMCDMYLKNQMYGPIIGDGPIWLKRV